MCLSKTKQTPEADIITTPQTGYSFVSPYIEDYSRRILGSYFGSPGEYEGLHHYKYKQDKLHKA